MKKIRLKIQAHPPNLNLDWHKSLPGSLPKGVSFSLLTLNQQAILALILSLQGDSNPDLPAKMYPMGNPCWAYPQ
jgi:hypothetical protein